MKLSKPLSDSDKATLLVGIISRNIKDFSGSREQCSAILAALADWPIHRAEQAFAQAHLNGHIFPADHPNN